MEKNTSPADDLVADLTAIDTIGAAVRDAMTAAYRQGWDDAAIFHQPAPAWWRRGWFAPIPADELGREGGMLAEDWVPSEAPGYVARVHTAITGLLLGRHRRRTGLGIVVGPPEINIIGSAPAGMILDEIAIDEIARQAAEGGRH